MDVFSLSQAIWFSRKLRSTANLLANVTHLGQKRFEPNQKSLIVVISEVFHNVHPTLLDKLLSWSAM